MTPLTTSDPQVAAPSGGPVTVLTSDTPIPSGDGLRLGVDWSDETGAQTAEYGIVTLAAVGFAGLLAVILSGGDVKGLLTTLIKGALSLG